MNIVKYPKNDLENFDTVEIDGVEGYGTALITTAPFASFPKPKESINLNVDTMNRLLDFIPTGENAIPYSKMARANKELKPFSVKGDIILAETIPAKDLIMTVNMSNGESVTAQFIICDSKSILEQLKEHPDTPAIAGVVKMIPSLESNKIRKDIAKLIDLDKGIDCFIRINHNLEIDWYPGFSVKRGMFELFSEDFSKDRVGGEVRQWRLDFLHNIIRFRDMTILLWYGLQLALLNPVIKERVKRETIPYEDTKRRSSKPNKKAPKKYIKRIVLGDISDIPLGKSSSHEMKESFWWVSGHFRNQKVKDGYKLIFIQGYWKGPLRETAEKLYDTPRERKLVFKEQNNADDSNRDI